MGAAAGVHAVFTTQVERVRQDPGRTRIEHRDKERNEMSTRKINITPAERVGRLAAGLALLGLAIPVLEQGIGVVTIVGAVLLLGAGLDLAVTGARGCCPLYAKLAYVPRSLRGRRP